MKASFLLVVLFSFITLNAQKIGELAPEKPSEKFPPNSWGMDILFGEGGFGLGTFFRHNFMDRVNGFVDFSISESKDDREFEYIDIFGQSFVVGKKNRVFFLPLNFGIQYRLFKKILTDNLRPYVSAAIGPTFLVTTPYEKEFFKSFAKAQLRYALGGYVGLGADFGLSKSNLIGLNLRYYYSHIFGEGVENLEGRFRPNIASFYLSINIGIMY